MLRVSTIGCLLVSVVLIAAGCSTPGTEYGRLEKKELSKGKRVDSLFMGISLGMTSKNFYSYCWEMNKKGTFTDGSNNTMVLYKLKSGLAHPANMNFYPDFYEDKIVVMRVSFQYEAWAPWNKNLQADSLLPDVLNLYRKWYPGNDFITMTDKKKGTIYVKIDGNRRLTVGKYDDATVKADYTDLLIEKKFKK